MLWCRKKFKSDHKMKGGSYKEIENNVTYYLTSNRRSAIRHLHTLWVYGSGYLYHRNKKKQLLIIFLGSCAEFHSSFLFIVLLSRTWLIQIDSRTCLFTMLPRTLSSMVISNDCNVLPCFSTQYCPSADECFFHLFWRSDPFHSFHSDVTILFRFSVVQRCPFRESSVVSFPVS